MVYGLRVLDEKCLTWYVYAVSTAHVCTSSTSHSTIQLIYSYDIIFVSSNYLYDVNIGNLMILCLGYV